ncbi:hypothetical protein [Oceanibacterium hippocampi]|uniref:Protein kinase domain-containing protein n=1 Tax=Oceanibacterium hippocampi TaxID=745714 RepID=A0A1Y5U0K4_9PROT|nr:hypothetical protein [Oceanibacterium hippocampi]SLN73100.1 hypothetical protein OCH7691_03569 [Oceanibacterium hippocampi]
MAAIAEFEDEIAEDDADTGLPAGTIGDRYRVDFNAPLPAYDRGRARAFRAHDRDNAGRPLFALSLDRATPCRKTLIAKLIRQPVPSLLCPVADGPVGSGVKGISRRVLIFDRPGPPLREHLSALKPDHLEKFLANVLLPRIAEALSGLAERGFAHRAISLDNVFFGNDKAEGIVLGECVSAPPGALSHSVYEQVESAIAEPFARGWTNREADLYALGVLVVAILGGETPFADEAATITTRRRLSEGSCKALTRNLRCSSRKRVLIAGLLSDSIERRWTAERVKRWTEGFLEEAVVHAGDRHAPSPCQFAGEDHVHPRALAVALTESPAKAARFIASGKLESWIRNSLGDQRMAVEIAEAVARGGASSGRPAALEAMLVSRTALALDPDGPIWYRGLRLARGGLPAAIVDAVGSGDGARVATIAEFLAGPLLREWITHEAKRIKSERTSITEPIAVRIAHFVNDATQYGKGMERVLYELNPDLPCLSPTLDNAYVGTIGELLAALDVRASQISQKSRIFDRHVAAFIASRVENVDGVLKEIGSRQPTDIQWAVAVLSLLATLQHHFHAKSLPGLSRAVAAMLRSQMSEIFSTARREVLVAKIDALAEKGDLSRMHDSLDLAAQLRIDRAEFEDAVAYYGQIDRRCRVLAARPARESIATQDLSDWLASSAAFIAMMASAAGTLFVFLT